MSATLNRWAVPVLAALGLADSTYLSVLHWMGEIPPCGGYAGCETVNTSEFAEIFGIPTAAFGMLISAAVLVVSLWRLRTEGRSWLYATIILYGLVLSAALFMSYLTGIELLVLRAVCYWCLGMFATVLANLILLVREIWVTTATAGAT